MNKVSNSKLTKEQKRELKVFQADNPEIEFTTFQEHGITIAIMQEFRGSEMALVAVSTMSRDEKKFRPNVGKFHAMHKLTRQGEFIKVEMSPDAYYHFAYSLSDCMASAANY